MQTEIIDLDRVAHNWWVVLVRGVTAILVGVLTLVVPGISLAALVLLFGAYALIDGSLALVSAIRGRRVGRTRWALGLEGIIGAAAGIGALFWPGLAAIALVLLVGAWALITGILELVAAVQLRKYIEGEWLLAVSGIASVVLGIVLLSFPGPGALALVVWIGAYALLFGVLLVALGLRLRSFRDTGPSVGVRGLSSSHGTERPQHG
jgi:uncharacterized membrane protein HdeD (DUF308 family)